MPRRYGRLAEITSLSQPCGDFEQGQRYGLLSSSSTKMTKARDSFRAFFSEPVREPAPRDLSSQARQAYFGPPYDQHPQLRRDVGGAIDLTSKRPAAVDLLT